MNITKPIVFLILVGMLILFLTFRAFPESTIVLQHSNESTTNESGESENNPQEGLDNNQEENEAQTDYINGENKVIDSNQDAQESCIQELRSLEEAHVVELAECEANKPSNNDQIDSIAIEKESIEREKVNLSIERARLDEEHRIIDETTEAIHVMQQIVINSQMRADSELKSLREALHHLRYLEYLTYILIIGLAFCTILFNLSMYLIYRNRLLSIIGYKESNPN